MSIRRRGTFQGTRIDLEGLSSLDITPGTPVDVEITPVEAGSGLRRGSPEALLAALGKFTFTDEEANAFNEVLKQMRRVEPEMWGPGPFGT